MPRITNNEVIFDSETNRLIRTKARRLSRRRGFCSSDLPDIEQELRLHLVVQAPKFDAAVTTWEKFVSFILDKQCVSLWRYRAAAMRSSEREECSLNDPVLDADDRLVDRHETTPEATNVPQRLRDLERDVAEVLDRLSEEMRAVARGLATGTVNSVAIELGISRNKVNRIVRDLRQRFDDAGLRHYL